MGEGLGLVRKLRARSRHHVSASALRSRRDSFSRREAWIMAFGATGGGGEPAIRVRVWGWDGEVRDRGRLGDDARGFVSGLV